MRRKLVRKYKRFKKWVIPELKDALAKQKKCPIKVFQS